MTDSDRPHCTRRAWQDGPTAVYRHYDAAGCLLYVGCSSDPHSRFVNHKCSSPWAFRVATISLEWFDDRATALAAEKAAIEAERPPYNSSLGGRRGRAWSENLGHVYITQWLKSSGVTLDEFAARLGVSIAEARRLASEVRHIRTPKQCNVCIATDGYVPTAAWDRRYAKNFALRSGAPVTATAEEAAKEAKRCLDLVRAWGKYASPYTQLLLSNALPACQERGAA